MKPKDFQKAYNFFREHAGHLVDQSAYCAFGLARAEVFAKTRGFLFSWERDEYFDLSWADEKTQEAITDVEVCTMLDSNGRAIASIGGVTFSIHTPDELQAARAYSRVVEAELAAEVMLECERAARADIEAHNYLAL
jgi:hypothetical protein